MSFISAGNTTTTTLVVNGDTTGNLVFNTGGANTTALTLTNTQGANFVGSVSALNTFGFKNRLINGGMVIDQRNAGASLTITNTSSITYTLDRWYAYGTQASKISVQQNAGSVTPPVGFTNYLGVTALSAYTVGASDSYQVSQAIEGLNVADLGWGTANAKTVTLSFQVYSSLTGTFGGVFQNSANNRNYPFTYSIPTANTWTSISVTIAGDTSGTWLTTNGTGIIVKFGLGVGSTFSGTAGAWVAGNLISATGAVSVVGTNGATFYITGVQFEVGSQATSFDFRDYGRELILCYRYCQKLTSVSGFAFQNFGWGNGNGTSTNNYIFVPTITPLRATPTVTFSTIATSIGSTGTAVSSISGPTISQNLVHLTVAAGTYSLGQSINMQCDANAAGFLQFSAEL